MEGREEKEGMGGTEGQRAGGEGKREEAKEDRGEGRWWEGRRK